MTSFNILLIVQECYQKLCYIINQNGMTLENWVKIEGAMGKNISVKFQRPKNVQKTYVMLQKVMTSFTILLISHWSRVLSETLL